MRRIKRRRAGSLAKVAELAMAAPQVAAIRTARMLAAAANPGAADRAELSQMCTEKVQAFWESMFAMNAQVLRAQQEYTRTAALEWWRLWATPWWLAASRPLAEAMPPLPRAPGFEGPVRRQRQRRLRKSCRRVSRPSTSARLPMRAGSGVSRSASVDLASSPRCAGLLPRRPARRLSSRAR